MTIDSASADSEKICVLTMARFPGNALRIARKRDKNPGQVFRQMPQAVNPHFTNDKRTQAEGEKPSACVLFLSVYCSAFFRWTPKQASSAPMAQTRQAIHSVWGTDRRSSIHPLTALASTEPSVVMEKARLWALAESS